MTSRKIEKNNRYGRLVILNDNPKRYKKTLEYLCICDCGTEKYILIGSLRSGKTQSCGCLHREISKEVNTKHGGHIDKKRTLDSWRGMKERCKNPNNSHYEDYGKRGIDYCMNWEYFENFLADMGERPERMTLDRIDVNGDYTKDNCRWVTDSIQSFNKQTTLNKVCGVYQYPSGRWYATISKSPTGQEFLGSFDNYLDAVETRILAEFEKYGFCKNYKIERY